MTPHEFGCKVANWFSDYNDQFENMYGLDLRLPHDYQALRQLGAATALGGVLGLGRGLIWPGYVETKDDLGRIIAKKRRNPWLGALEGAALGAGSSALSNYASQTLTQYNPEIDKLLENVKNRAMASWPVSVTPRQESVDVGKQLFDRITTTA